MHQRLHVGEAHAAGQSHAGTESKRNGGLEGQSIAVRFGDARIEGERRERGILPRVIEPCEVQPDTKFFSPDLATLETKPEAGVLLDQFVDVVEHDASREPVTTAGAGHREVQHTAPALLGVVDQLRSRRREWDPRLLDDLEDDANPAAFRTFRNSSRDIASRQFFLETLLQSIGFVRVEALANELLKIVAELLTDVARRPLEIHALDDVAGVDVFTEIGVLADACDEEDDVRFAVGADDAAHRRDHFGLLAFDARDELIESFAIERRTDQRVEFFLKSGTQAVRREA